MIRTALVDDEPPARRKLRHLLGAEPDIDIVGEAGTGAEAIELLNEKSPELVFLDIELPDCSGFDVLEALPSRDALQIVFVTAHDDFALKAFDVHAIDYVLKPVEPSRFTQSLQRIRRLREQRDQTGLASRLDELVKSLRSEPAFARRLLVQDGERSVFLETPRIDWIESARNYACLHSGGRTYILRSSLESMGAKLDPAIFRRINRSEIVNVEQIAEVRSWFHGDQKIRLKTGEELTWSRRYRNASVEELERA
jgi:two-component system, LytTR family, response regulator